MSKYINVKNILNIRVQLNDYPGIYIIEIYECP